MEVQHAFVKFWIQAVGQCLAHAPRKAKEKNGSAGSKQSTIRILLALVDVVIVFALFCCSFPPA